MLDIQNPRIPIRQLPTVQIISNTAYKGYAGSLPEYMISVFSSDLDWRWGWGCSSCFLPNSLRSIWTSVSTVGSAPLRCDTLKAIHTSTNSSSSTPFEMHISSPAINSTCPKCIDNTFLDIPSHSACCAATFAVSQPHQLLIALLSTSAGWKISSFGY